MSDGMSRGRAVVARKAVATERFVNADGVVVETELTPDAVREISVGRVVSLSPPLVQVSDREKPVPIAARFDGLRIAEGDFVAIFRVEHGVVAMSKVVML